MATVYIGLGSNLGDRNVALQKACAAISALNRVSELKLSNIYETEPVGPKDQGKFLNSVAKVQTTIEPIELRRKFAHIESTLGRPGKEKRIHWGPRIIDIDVLLYDQLIINHPELIIPHPQMTKREFVLKPLADLAPNLRHPTNGKTIAQLLEQLERLHLDI